MKTSKKKVVKELFFICYKCGHHLFVDETAQWMKKIITSDCPSCGEEPERNWILGGYGSFKNWNGPKI
jgi:transcription elongation factor Elf1